MDENKKKIILDKKPISEEVVQKIKRCGIRIGSRAYGVAKPDSDHDYIVHPMDKGQFLDLTDYYCDFMDSETYQEGDRNILYFHTEKGEIYNVMVFHFSEAFYAWAGANSMILTLLENSPEDKRIIADRDKRVNLFKAFREFYKPIPEEDGEVIFDV